MDGCNILILLNKKQNAYILYQDMSLQAVFSLVNQQCLVVSSTGSWALSIKELREAAASALLFIRGGEETNVPFAKPTS